MSLYEKKKNKTHVSNLKRTVGHWLRYARAFIVICALIYKQHYNVIFLIYLLLFFIFGYNRALNADFIIIDF